MIRAPHPRSEEGSDGADGSGGAGAPCSWTVDDWSVVAGALGVSTDANAAWWTVEGIGTIPHGLIAAYGGDTLKATLAFDRFMPKEVDRIALVDFDNDCVGASLEVARALGRRLWGVRLDTASDLRDKSVQSDTGKSYGVCPELVRRVRQALDAEQFNHVRIVVSGGFNARRIRRFVQLEVPFDAVGVGSALVENRIHFTADVVMVEGRPLAKVGRGFNPNPRLQVVE